MTTFKGILQIRRIRSRGTIGGVIFSAATLENPPIRYVVKADWKIAPVTSLFREGHLWDVSGVVDTQVVKWQDGTESKENVLVPDELKFVKASNENLKKLLTESKDFRGISQVKAEKLVSFFGDDLYDIAANNQLERLLPILGEEVATRLIEGLNQYQELSALRLLDDLGVPHHIGESVLKIWGCEAYDKIRENPYLLGVFMADLKVVDEYAINRLGFCENSPLRLTAYVKDVMFNAFKTGNTCLPTSDVKYRVKRLLGDLSHQAFDLAVTSGEIIVEGAITQVRSMHIIESSVASIIRKLAESPSPPSLVECIERQVKVFERRAGIELTFEQKNAVMQCCTSRLTLLTGGAGCGKTTVIEAICFALEKLSQTSHIYIMALAGKAAQRITEATGRDAMTIASFMYNVDAEDIPDDAVIIVDEASMVDILSLLKLLKRVPPRGRLILTGNEQQLPPVGIGLSLHELVKTSIRNPVLTAVKRQSEESGIPAIANQIRNYGEVKSEIVFSSFEGLSDGVSFVECDINSLEHQVLRIYEELGGDGTTNDVLILSSTKHLTGGVSNINALIHDKHSKGHIISFNEKDFGQVTHHINGRPLRLGEQVMYTRNDYQKDIRNGSVGSVVGKIGEVVTIDFDGNNVDLSLPELSSLEHAYSLTVHKSQGSQFERVIVVIKKGRNLDRHLIYTALTRAKKQVVFVGDKDAFYQALNTSNAQNRYTKLSHHLAGVEGMCI